MQLMVEGTFEASHVLPKHPGKCSHLHGHSWLLRVYVSGVINPETGFVVDYADLKKVVRENVIDVLDHQHLGHGDLVTPYVSRDEAQRQYPAVFGSDFYPTSENLSKKIFEILRPLIHPLGARLEKVEVRETLSSLAIAGRDDA